MSTEAEKELEKIVDRVRYVQQVDEITNCVSLQTVIGLEERGEVELLDILPGDREQEPETLAILGSTSDLLIKIVNSLRPIERLVIKLRFGLDREDDSPKTLQEIGDMYGVCRERIRQIEVAALESVKKALNRMKLERSDL